MFKKVAILFISLFALNFEFILNCPTENSNDLIIDTKSGKIRGACNPLKINDVNNDEKSSKIFSWLSIPYAQPPVNENRFKSPKPIRAWTNILDGTKVPNSCMQATSSTELPENLEFLNMFTLSKSSSSKLSEDCLYLNVFVSENTKTMNKKSPVLVFFHGGSGGTIGSSVLEIYDPSVFVAMTDVIVVSVNYRLDVFGFLHLKDDDENLDGNQAILDQNMALKWVSENIDRFGGDSGRVTLLGSGSGARLVGYHLLYRPSFAYFRNAILHSGSPVNLRKNSISSYLANERARLFLMKTLGCKKGNLVSCARKVSAQNLTQSSAFLVRKTIGNGSLVASMGVQSLFGPVMEDNMFKESPIRGFRVGNYKKCNILTGFNANEGSSFVPFNYGTLNKTSKNHPQTVSYEQMVEFLKQFLAFYPTHPYHNSELLLNSILFEYTHLTTRNFQQSYMLRDNYLSTLRKILTDESYACPTFKLIESLAKNSNSNRVYLYTYNYRISSSKWPKWYGVVHGDEIAMLFGQPLNDRQNKKLGTSFNPWVYGNYSNRDKEVSKEMMTRWANFIRDDDPNGKETGSERMKWVNYQLSKMDERGHDDDILENNTESSSSASHKKTNMLYYSLKNDGTFAVNKVQNLVSCHMWNILIPGNLDVLAEMKKKNQYLRRN